MTAPTERDIGPNLDELLAEKLPRGRRPELAPDVTKERRKEQMRRAGRAQGLAITALRHLYPDDFQFLLAQAKAKVDAESGPLPGDEPS